MLGLLASSPSSPSSAQTGQLSQDMSTGLSLLLVRPQLLIANLHNLVLSLAFRLAGQEQFDMYASTAFTRSFGSEIDVPDPSIPDELHGQLALNQEIIDKVRGMESKLEYQIKKLSALADVSEKADDTAEDPEEDLLAFRPNPSAIKATEPKADQSGDVYRPPRIAAVPYTEASTSRRTERRAPALLSEFASTLQGAPGMETTSGLSTVPVRADRHTNSASAKRAAELQRINEFEEENMTRLVTTKREAKRRREDEAALALGYGVGGTGRNRGNRQNGLEAELEGVLGERRGGVWKGVSSKLGSREGLFERGKRPPGEKKAKKARFEKDVHRHK